MFCLHLLVSAALVGTAIGAIVYAWYPPPFAQLEGIFSILAIMAFVDVCAGPLCTLVAASAGKTRGHLARDLAVIAFVQVCALGYAVYTTWIARPVFVVYSTGMFEVEHANEISSDELLKVADTRFRSLPLVGPVFVEARFPEDAQTTMKIVNSAINGGPDIKDMPQYFTTWPFHGTDAREKAKAVASLPEHKPLRDKVEELLRAHQVAESDALVLPINGKIDRGTVVVRRSDLAVLGIVPFLSP